MLPYVGKWFWGRSDGDHILTETTSDLVARLFGIAIHGDFGVPPGSGQHHTLILREEAVRTKQAVIEQLAIDRGEDAVEVTGSDIREGCRIAIAAAALDDLARELAVSAPHAAT